VDAPLARIVQLIQKTNQFNLTTRRHSEAEVLRIAEKPGALALGLRSRDRFGDLGVVGVVLGYPATEIPMSAARSAADTGHAAEFYIDTFLLSCRVIGRGIETALLALVAAHARRIGARYLRGEYIATRKN